MEEQQETSGCLGILLKLFSGGGQPVEQETGYPFEPGKFLSPAERSFFGVLQVAVDGEFVIFAKVRMADLIKIRKGTEKRQSHFNRISAKHVDFVLCTTDTVEPVLVIELDDASHKKESAKAADDFKDKAFAAAGLPVLRIAAKRGYVVDDVVEQINAKLPD